MTRPRIAGAPSPADIVVGRFIIRVLRPDDSVNAGAIGYKVGADLKMMRARLKVMLLDLYPRPLPFFAFVLEGCFSGRHYYPVVDGRIERPAYGIMAAPGLAAPPHGIFPGLDSFKIHPKLFNLPDGGPA